MTDGGIIQEYTLEATKVWWFETCVYIFETC